MGLAGAARSSAAAPSAPSAASVDADLQLDLSAFAGVELYEPEELVLKVRAGTPVSQIREMLAKRNQQLAFEPPQYAALFGSTSEDTIGGVVACNLSGPRRILAGSARDAVLGIEAVKRPRRNIQRGWPNRQKCNRLRHSTASHWKLWSSGGDHLDHFEDSSRSGAGSHAYCSPDSSDTEALQVLSGALRMPLDISAAVHLSGRSSDSVTAFRLEGFSESVAARERELGKYLERMGPVTSMAGDESTAFWRRQRDLSDLASDPEACVWRLPCFRPRKPLEWLLRFRARRSL